MINQFLFAASAGVCAAGSVIVNVVPAPTFDFTAIVP